jgi:hypothetical protein
MLKIRPPCLVERQRTIPAPARHQETKKGRALSSRTSLLPCPSQPTPRSDFGSPSPTGSARSGSSRNCCNCRGEMRNGCASPYVRTSCENVHVPPIKGNACLLAIAAAVRICFGNSGLPWLCATTSRTLENNTRGPASVQRVGFIGQSHVAGDVGRFHVHGQARIEQNQPAKVRWKRGDREHRHGPPRGSAP